MRSTVGITAVGVASFAVGATIGAPAAHADVPGLSPSLCQNQPYYHSVGSYSNPGKAALPLRCGNNSFGIKHLVNRGHPVDATANTKIQNTLTYGEQKDPGAKELFDDNCNPLYLVAYGYNAYNNNDQNANPVGIITAYPLNVGTAVAPSPPPTTAVTARTAAAAGFRTDCPIIVPIGD
jgi:hypothetical protein